MSLIIKWPLELIVVFTATNLQAMIVGLVSFGIVTVEGIDFVDSKMKYHFAKLTKPLKLLSHSR